MTERSPRARASYGVDAPTYPMAFLAGALFLAIIAAVNAVVAEGNPWAVIGPALGALFFLVSAALFLHATRRGKFVVWAELLDGLGLTGDERVLDLGCGRGAVLIAAAQRVPGGRVVGIDLWRSIDQSGNREEVARANAEAEGVADRVELRTGDVTDLPFGDGEFDVVLSSLVIHNIRGADKRDRAVTEAYRVLRPGGRLLIVDIGHVPTYAARLEQLGAAGIERRSLGWRYWYGGPWVAASSVTATRPG